MRLILQQIYTVLDMAQMLTLENQRLILKLCIYSNIIPVDMTLHHIYHISPLPLPSIYPLCLHGMTYLQMHTPRTPTMVLGLMCHPSFRNYIPIVITSIIYQILYSCQPSCNLLVVSSQDLRSLSCDFYIDLQ